MFLNRFIKELHRRNVIRAGIAYVAIAWVILQAGSIIFPAWNLPDYSLRYLIIGISVLFPVWLIIAWIYDYTPQGIKKTEDENENQEKTYPGDRKKSNVMILAALILAIILLVLDRLLNLSEGFIHSEPQLAIAVLPFSNLSGDPQQTYFADGMQDELIGQLAQLDNLRVTSRISTLKYRNTQLSLIQISDELDVDLIVEGSLLKYQDSVRIQIQLIDLRKAEDHLWNRMYDKSLNNILNMHSEVTMDIAQSIQLTLSKEDKNHLIKEKSINPLAYDALLKARFHIFQFTPQNISTGLQYVNRALEIDPDMPQAYSTLAMIGAAMMVSGQMSPIEAGEFQRKNVQKCLELDGESAQCQFSLALLKTWHDWDWPEAEKAWKAALDIAPNDAMTHMYYSHYLFHMKRFDEAIAHGKLALSLDPFNPMFHGLFVVTLVNAGEYKQALEQADKAVEMDPLNPFCAGALSLAFIANDRKEEGFDMTLKQLTLFGDTILSNTMSRVRAQKDIKAAYIAGADLMLSRRKEGYVRPFGLALYYDLGGDPERAVQWFDTSFKYKDHDVLYARTSECYLSKEFRTHPKYQEIMQRLNFPASRQ